MTDQERIERAYRLAWPDEPDAPRDCESAELAWADASGWLSNWGGEERCAINSAILALALLDGGGTLGRWTVSSEPEARNVCRWRFVLGVCGAFRGRVQAWTVELEAGAYLDGTAQELLLLMAAADELARREVQP